MFVQDVTKANEIVGNISKRNWLLVVANFVGEARLEP